MAEWPAVKATAADTRRGAPANEWARPSSAGPAAAVAAPTAPSSEPAASSMPPQPQTAARVTLALPFENSELPKPRLVGLANGQALLISASELKLENRAPQLTYSAQHYANNAWSAPEEIWRGEWRFDPILVATNGQGTASLSFPNTALAVLDADGKWERLGPVQASSSSNALRALAMDEHGAIVVAQAIPVGESISTPDEKVMVWAYRPAPGAAWIRGKLEDRVRDKSARQLPVEMQAALRPVKALAASMRDGRIQIVVGFAEQEVLDAQGMSIDVLDIAAYAGDPKSGLQKMPVPFEVQGLGRRGLDIAQLRTGMSTIVPFEAFFRVLPLPNHQLTLLWDGVSHDYEDGTTEGGTDFPWSLSGAPWRARQLAPVEQRDLQGKPENSSARDIEATWDISAGSPEPVIAWLTQNALHEARFEPASGWKSAQTIQQLKVSREKPTCRVVANRHGGFAAVWFDGDNLKGRRVPNAQAEWSAEMLIAKEVADPKARGFSAGVKLETVDLLDAALSEDGTLHVLWIKTTRTDQRLEIGVIQP